MKRKDIIGRLLSEGFSEKTLSRMGDRELAVLAKTVLKEEIVMIKSGNVKAIEDAKRDGRTIETYESELSEKKPSAGLSKEKKSEVVKTAKKGGDIGKKGKGFEKIVKKAEESGAKDPKAVAAAAMWKNVQRENEVESWVLNLAEEKFSTFTKKSEIMEIIGTKVKETSTPMPANKARKGHNGVPEFMSYDAIVSNQPSPSPAQPDIDTPTKPGTPEKPSKPKTPYEPGPGTNPKPKAMGEEKNKKR